MPEFVVTTTFRFSGTPEEAADFCLELDRRTRETLMMTADYHETDRDEVSERYVGVFLSQRIVSD